MRILAARLDFDKQVYEWVARIPSGYVASYGQLALLAGQPGWAHR